MEILGSRRWRDGFSRLEKKKKRRARSHATFVLALEGRGSNEEVYLSDLNALEKI